MNLNTSKLGRSFTHIAVAITFNHFDIAYRIQYIIHQVLPLSGNPWTSTFLVYFNWFVEFLYVLMDSTIIYIAIFSSWKFSSGYNGFFDKEVTGFHWQGLYEAAISNSSFEGTLQISVHVLTSSQGAIIELDFTFLLYSIIPCLTNDRSVDNWTASISETGNFHYRS